MSGFPFIKQHDAMECGVACLAMMCKFFRMEYSKTFDNLLLEILLLYMAIQRKKISLRWSVTVPIASRPTERISTAAGPSTLTGLSSTFPFPGVI